MSAVYRRELKANLFSMTGTIFVVFALVFIGFFCGFQTFMYGSAHLEEAIFNAGFMSLLAVPILTMKTFTEERQNKTDQLLFSLPLTTLDVVLGKFLALATVMAVPTAVLCIYPLITAALTTAGNVNFALIYAAVFTYFIMGCAVIAICMFLSSLTESQVISAVISLAVVLLLNYMSSFASIVPTGSTFSFVIALLIIVAVAYIIWISLKNYYVAGGVGAALIVGASVLFALKPEMYEGLVGRMFSAIAVFQPLVNVVSGVLDIGVVIYYLSVIVLFVFVTVQAVEKRRWS